MRNAVLAIVAVVAIAAGVWAISYNNTANLNNDFNTITPAAGDEAPAADAAMTAEPATETTTTEEVKAEASELSAEAKAKADEAGHALQANWDQFKGQVKQKWGQLTDDDLTVMTGKRDELSGKVQERYGVTKEEADRQVDEWLAGLQPAPAAEPVAE